METRVAARSPELEAVPRGVGDGDPADPALAAALVAALEGALLAARHLIGALGTDRACHAGATGRREPGRMWLAPVEPRAITGGLGRTTTGATTRDTEAPPIARQGADGLSRREAEVLGMRTAGRSNRDIARVLCLSPRTVQRHVANAYRKIGAHRRAEATAYALRHGLV